MSVKTTVVWLHTERLAFNQNVSSISSFTLPRSSCVSCFYPLLQNLTLLEPEDPLELHVGAPLEHEDLLKLGYPLGLGDTFRLLGNPLRFPPVNVVEGISTKRIKFSIEKNNASFRSSYKNIL